MARHTALANLPSLLTAAGLNVEVADGWEDGQCDPSKRVEHYLWTDPVTRGQSHDNPPSGYMVHHTAGTMATPPGHIDSKANVWAGLKRDGRLYQSGGGVPTLYLATAGPARISAGYGHKSSLWDHTFKDRRAPVHAEGPDGDTAANRFMLSVETVHPGNGSALHPGVWDHVVGLGIVLHQMFGWTERTVGHLSWTSRKIDPRWTVGKPNDGGDCIIDIQDAIGATMPEYKTTSNPAFQPAWNKAIDSKIFSEYTEPDDEVTAEKLAVFLDRAGVLDR